jgi:intracellular septation protein A
MTTTASQTTPAVGVTEDREPSARESLRKALLPLALDVAVPLGSYYLLAALGFGVVPALAISGVVPAIRTIYSVVRYRQTEPLALFTLMIAVISIPVSLVTGSPRFMLAKESIGTGPLGVWLIISALRGKPAMATAFRAFLANTPKKAVAWDRLMAGSAEFRHCMKAATIVWGAGFAAEFVIRLVVVFGLPVSTAIWAASFPMIGCILICIVVAGRWNRRAGEMIKAEVAA